MSAGLFIVESVLKKLISSSVMYDEATPINAETGIMRNNAFLTSSRPDNVLAIALFDDSITSQLLTTFQLRSGLDKTPNAFIGFMEYELLKSDCWNSSINRKLLSDKLFVNRRTTASGFTLFKN